MKIQDLTLNQNKPESAVSAVSEIPVSGWVQIINIEQWVELIVTQQKY